MQRECLYFEFVACLCHCFRPTDSNSAIEPDSLWQAVKQKTMRIFTPLSGINQLWKYFGIFWRKGGSTEKEHAVRKQCCYEIKDFENMTNLARHLTWLSTSLLLLLWQY